jgi:hypothetical protein
MKAKRAHELRERAGQWRDQAGQWRTIAERISDADPKAAEALNDLASRLDRQLFILEHRSAHDGAALMPQQPNGGPIKATTVRSLRP